MPGRPVDPLRKAHLAYVRGRHQEAARLRDTIERKVVARAAKQDQWPYDDADLGSPSGIVGGALGGVAAAVAGVWYLVDVIRTALRVGLSTQISTHVEGEGSFTRPVHFDLILPLILLSLGAALLLRAYLGWRAFASGQ